MMVRVGVGPADHEHVTWISSEIAASSDMLDGDAMRRVHYTIIIRTMLAVAAVVAFAAFAYYIVLMSRG
jgi:hypothetical protein